MGFDDYGRWPRYVPVAERRQKAAKAAQKLAKKGQALRPIKITSRNISSTFWGKAWCQNLESYADYSNRMPRGRTYARNGSIIDLQIAAGSVTALVSGSNLYRVAITIGKLSPKTWKAICADCSIEVTTLIDLLTGKLPDKVLTRLTDRQNGMFPKPTELKIKCSCPDGARMCKHGAATLYGVGHLLDTEPELFFIMRGVDQAELVADALDVDQATERIGLNADSSLADADLGSIFGIELTTSDKPTSTNVKSVASKTKAVKGSSRSTKPKPGKSQLIQQVDELTNSQSPNGSKRVSNAVPKLRARLPKKRSVK